MKSESIESGYGNEEDMFSERPMSESSSCSNTTGTTQYLEEEETDHPYHECTVDNSHLHATENNMHSQERKPLTSSNTQRNRRVKKQVKTATTKHNYGDWEQKLTEGILDVTQLHLHEVPSAIFDYSPSLKIIYMAENYIREIPQDFFDELPCLAWLDLRGNKLKTLAGPKFQHKALRTLLLQENELSCLPYSLYLAENLKNIGWTGNPMVDPPKEIRHRGCSAILMYLKKKMMNRTPLVRLEKLEVLKHEQKLAQADDRLAEDLRKTLLKCSKQKKQPSAGNRPSSSEAFDSKDMEARRIERIKYTWGLWKNFQYDGPSQQDLFKKSLKEMQNQVVQKLELQKDAVLQRVKNYQALKNWRDETRKMQYNGRPAVNYTGLEPPFGTNLNVKPLSSSPYPVLSPDEFKREISDCWVKLKEYSSAPVSVTNVNEALSRLQDVEEIQRKILNMRLSVKSGTF